MVIHRRVLQLYTHGGVTFTVERWFMAVDTPEESATYFALVWNADDDSKEHAVALSHDAAARIARLLSGEDKT